MRKLGGVLFFLLAASAFAQTPAETEAAERYERGIKLYDAAKGDAAMYRAALAEFEAAYRLSPLFQILYNVAVTQKKLGRYGQALQTFEDYLKAGGDGVPEARREAVKRDVAEIRSLVGEVEVIVKGPPADLSLDGQPLGQAPLARPLMLVSGTHVFKASRAGYLPDEKQLNVLSGNSYKVELAPTPRDIGELKISSVPEGASLLLDDKPLGKAPWTGEVSVGGHKLLAQLEGYDPSTQEIVIAAGQTREVTVELKAPTPWFKRWYVWTAVGVVVAGGAYAGYELTRFRPDHVVRQ